jgi:hypothetical protein
METAMMTLVFGVSFGFAPIAGGWGERQSKSAAGGGAPLAELIELVQPKPEAHAILFRSFLPRNRELTSDNGELMCAR